MNQVRWAFHQ